MSVFEMVVAIVGIVMVSRVLRARYCHRTATDTMMTREDAAALIGQVQRLNERVATLERLATDPAKRIAAEIDALR
ncbi:hypothetical protein E6W36_07590 [Hankyongella ginsenosidimutans]|uniref:Uncharacterized protein n=1 Tax=Hankyongella ginsenosidimutans TaxID=1763828 RepID=A0A4D7C7X2_9SPHN|nr:hypothetical protein E6W36_07590 [Hankyongella ginsenosidimutans]TXG83843.1 MAG: hypothetical protein E6R12_06830 [Sphingomonadales bacterium]